MKKQAVSIKRSAGRRPHSGKSPDPDTRSQILSAARCVFARRGLEGSSIREIAASANVNNAMIYYHFKDKIELYRAVLSDSFMAFERIWDHKIFNTPGSARIKISYYVEELIRFQHANEDLRKILSMEFACCSTNLEWLADNLFNRSYEKLTFIFKEGMRRGEIGKLDPSSAIVALVGIIIHSFIMKPMAEYITGRKLRLDAKIFGSFVTGMFFDGVASGKTPQSRRKTGHA